MTVYFATILTLTGFLYGTAYGAVQVQAHADTSRPIYAQSPFTYNIIISNGGNPDDVDLEPLKSFNPSGPSVQTTTSIINGQMSSSVILSYQLTAPDTGQAVIPATTVKVKGQIYHTNPVTITVVQAGTTKQIDINASLSVKRCYVGQPVTLTLTFYVWTDIARAQAITNIAFQSPAMDENLFFIEDADFQPANAQQTILAVNGQREIWYQDQTQHNGVDCVRLRLTKILIPRQAGSFLMKPSSVSADIAVSAKSSRGRGIFDDFFGPQYEYQRFSAASEPINLEVASLPLEGKPADFYGLVGHYTITASASPTQVSVGDPITLTISIGGGKYLKPVQWPRIEDIPAMSANFKIPSEHADGQLKDGAKVFTQTIRATSDQVTEIPPIPLTYFDSDKGSYVTITSQPIPLKVWPTKIVTGADVETQQLVSVNKELEALKEGLSANYTSADALQNQQFSIVAALTGPAFIILWVLPFTALLSSTAVKIITTNSPQRITARRRKLAFRRAAATIHALKESPSAAEQLASAMKQFIADKFDRVAGSLTAEDCRLLIFEKTGNAELAGQFKQLMEEIEAAAYSPLGYAFNQDKQQQLIQLLKRIEQGK